jgi:DivIVA domain-containing protein
MARKRKKRETEEAGFGEDAAPAQPDRQRMTPAEIQQKVFRLAFRGYNERDVDEFLDHLTEDLAAVHEENKRLKEQIQEGGVGPGLDEAQRQAETIVRQAREHAARLVEDAGQRAGAGPSLAPIAASFLVQERQFLQQLATLVQDHARRLKEEARRSRDQIGSATDGEPEPAPPEQPAGASEPPPADETVQASAGAASVAGAAEAAALADSPNVEEQTAPWSPMETSSAPPEREEPPAPRTASEDDRDPLVSAWEGAFSPGERDEEDDAAFGTANAERSTKRKTDEGEPSLRELFWGEE